MFEMIGLLIGTAFLFALAALVGLFFAFMARLIVPRSQCGRFLFSLPAFAIPILSAGYLWLCAALMPSQSLFGDIDQPLPNGYHLTALGKMPEYGSIGGSNPSTESLDVNGPLIAARVCHTCDAAFTDGAGPYLLIDTRTHATRAFATEEALSAGFGRPVNLIENQNFQSSELSYRRERTIENGVMFTPPLILTIAFFGWLVQLRRKHRGKSSAL